MSTLAEAARPTSGGTSVDLVERVGVVCRPGRLPRPGDPRAALLLAGARRAPPARVGGPRARASGRDGAHRDAGAGHARPSGAACRAALSSRRRPLAEAAVREAKTAARADPERATSRSCATSRSTVAGVLVLGGAAYGAVQLTDDDDGHARRQRHEAERRRDGGSATTAASDRRQVNVDPSQVTVAVLNGTTVQGLAAKVGEEVSADGFTPGTIGNAARIDQSRSEVLYRNGQAARRASGREPARHPDDRPGRLRERRDRRLVRRGRAGRQQTAAGEPSSARPSRRPLVFAALVVATVGAFFVTTRLKRSAPVVEQLTFSRTSRRTATAAVDTVAVRVPAAALRRGDGLDRDARRRRGAHAGRERHRARAARRYRFRWDGRTDAGRVAPRRRVPPAGRACAARAARSRRRASCSSTPCPRSPVVRYVSPDVDLARTASGRRATARRCGSPARQRRPRLLVYRTDLARPRLVARRTGRRGTDALALGRAGRPRRRAQAARRRQLPAGRARQDAAGNVGPAAVPPPRGPVRGHPG